MFELKRNHSVEVHGDEYAIYRGRNDNRHGFRLCNIHDFDMSKAHTVRTIDAGLLALEYIFDYMHRKEMHQTHSAENELEIMYNSVREVLSGTEGMK